MRLKSKEKKIIGEIIHKIGDKLSDNSSLRADIEELKTKVYELAEYYDNELAKSRRNLILVSILGGIGIIAAIVLAILL